MLAANENNVNQFGNGLSFAGHVANYPVCWSYNIGIPGQESHDLTGSPVLIQIGDKDDYDEGVQQCENLIASLSESDQSVTSLNIYKNSYHAWDRLQPVITVFDPFSHLGAGGLVDIIPNPGKAFQSRENTLLFFKDAFKMEDIQ